MLKVFVPIRHFTHELKVKRNKNSDQCASSYCVKAVDQTVSQVWCRLEFVYSNSILIFDFIYIIWESALQVYIVKIFIANGNFNEKNRTHWCHPEKVIVETFKGGGGGVKPTFLREHNFKIWVGHDGQDKYQQFEGSFVSIGATLPMWSLVAKMGAKNQNLKQGDRKMGKLWPCEAPAPKWRWLFWAMRWPFWPHFLRYDLQTYFAKYLDQYWRANRFITQLDPIKPFMSLNFQKSTKSPISQFAILRKWTYHFFLLLRHF